MITAGECDRLALEKAFGTLEKAIKERDELIEKLRADNVKLADQCNALREGREFADGAKKNP